MSDLETLLKASVSMQKMRNENRALNIENNIFREKCARLTKENERLREKLQIAADFDMDIPMLSIFHRRQI